MLVEQGKVSLDDDITKYLPDYPTQGHTITVEHLLTHTSGIKSYTGMPEWLSQWRKDLTLTELIDLFKDQPMDFAPGEKWSYNVWLRLEHPRLQRPPRHRARRRYQRLSDLYPAHAGGSRLRRHPLQP